ncbi:MAG: hypothetical protein LBT78_00570 [Tannerella sp.]|jgi:hypothetical protein|nr:hypothetical protein [Tannerella sp.]
MKRFFFTFIILLFVTGHARTQNNVWTASADSNWNPATAEYKIETAGQLAQLAVLVNGGETFEDITFTLTNDIDLSAHNWVPIGNDRSTPFCGAFDGDNHHIKGLKINNTITDYSGVYSALFGRIAGKARIRNLTLSDGEIKGGMGDGTFTAALVADVSPDDDSKPVHISYCYNLSVKVTAGSGARGGRTGGLIAVARTQPDGTGNAFITIEACGNKAPVTGVSTSNFTGGLIGWMSAGNKAVLMVTDCYNTAEVTGSKDCTGGLVGRMQASTEAGVTLRASVSTGKVKGGEGFTGGLVGHLTAADELSMAKVAACTVAVDELTGNKFHTGVFAGKNEHGILEDNREGLDKEEKP